MLITAVQCTRVLLYAKMLKETETEETVVFYVKFLSLVAFQLGGGRAPGYDYVLSSLTVASKKKISIKLTLPVNFYYLFTKSDLKVKTNIVLERRYVY